MADDPLIDAVLDGRYQVVERLAAGAMGVVYRGERVKLGRSVAIKFLHASLAEDPPRRQRFEIEARAMARLDHPHCASVIDVGLHSGMPYVVMDFIRGRTLRDLLDEGRIDVARSVELMRQILAGLAHAHELGIIHRDVKPANVMLTERAGLGEQVRILDFGLARLREEASTLTAGMIIGTPAYMAPEQCNGAGVEARTDLYACGILLFEMLTGDKPFDSDEAVELLRMQLGAVPPRLDARLPGERFGDLEAVVARALAKQPHDRFASAGDFATALTAAAARGTAEPPPPKPKVERRQLVIAAIAAGAVLLIGVLARIAS